MRRRTTWVAGAGVVFALAGGAAAVGRELGDEADRTRNAAATLPAVRETPRPSATQDIACTYRVTTARPNTPRFTAHGTLRNTGNIGVTIHANYKWRVGESAITRSATYSLRPGQARLVNVRVPVTVDALAAYWDAGSRCSAHVEVIDVYGQTPPAAD